MNAKVYIGNFINYLFNDLISHIPIHFVRISFLRLFNKNIHPTTKILMHSRILHFWKLHTEKNVVINQYSLIDCRRFIVTIAHNSDIGPYTKIWTLGHDPESSSHEVAGGPVNIGHHVWIASGATILPNVNVANGAIIAAGSVVTKHVDELSIVAGNPAKEIRKRKNDLNYKLTYTPIWE